MTSSRSIIGRWIAAGLAFLALLLAGYQLVLDNMPKGEVRVIDGYRPWSEEIVRLAETLPVQDGGRIKPLSTYAGFTMLRLHGARSMKVQDEKGQVTKIKPTEWLLDTLFRPELGYKLPSFRVDNAAALEAIGVEPRSRRDRYSYEDIEAGRAKLQELSQVYQAIDTKARDPMQNQIVDLAANLSSYEALFGYFTFARNGVVMADTGDGSKEAKRAEMSAIMATAPQLREFLKQNQARGGEMHPSLRAIFNQILDGANFSKFGIFLFPPLHADESKWNSVGEIIMGVMSGSMHDPESRIRDIAMLEKLARSTADPAAFREALVALHQSVDGRAAAGGKSKHVALEATYYRKDFFMNAMVFFLIGVLSMLAMWVLGKSPLGKMSYWVTVLCVTAGTLYCMVAIVIRCVIMQRPPIGNLYDTIIFIGAAVALIALLVEWMTRKRFALAMGPVLGAALVILARRYEVGDAQDHMDPLVAVLDSNYWLTTHVITITLGYSAGLLSAFLSAAYVLMRGLSLDEGQPEMRRALTRAVYGMICFTLFLSLVGTVLGGIWANDSWGRFWGWDPKENGALLIVLWTLAILHARMGGYIKEWGLHLASLFTAVVVTFSWWHVNFLGVGLHNYGFTSGKDAIWMFYIAIGVMIGFGMIAAAFEKSAKIEKAI